MFTPRTPLVRSDRLLSLLLKSSEAISSDMYTLSYRTPSFPTSTHTIRNTHASPSQLSSNLKRARRTRQAARRTVHAGFCWRAHRTKRHERGASVLVASSLHAQPAHCRRDAPHEDEVPSPHLLTLTARVSWDGGVVMGRRALACVRPWEVGRHVGGGSSAPLPSEAMVVGLGLGLTRGGDRGDRGRRRALLAVPPLEEHRDPDGDRADTDHPDQPRGR